MPLEAILQAIDAEAERQVADITRLAQDQVAQINADGQVQAQAIRQRHLAAIQAPLKAEQARIINQAKLQALQIVLGTREELISDLLETTADQLTNFSQQAEYAAFLKELVQETTAWLGADQPLRWRVKEPDVGLMQAALQSLGLTAIVDAGLDGENTVWNGGMGGLIALTADERIGVVNTLEMRLQRAANLYRGQIAAWLFESPTEA